VHDPELRNSPWQDLLTLPLPPELEQVEGEYVRHRLLRERKRYSRRAPRWPSARTPSAVSRRPGGVLPGPDAEGLQPVSCPELVKADPEVMTDAWQSLLRRYDADTG